MRYIIFFILPWKICNSSTVHCYGRNFGSLVYKCSDNFLSFETEDEVLCCKIDKFQFFHLPTSQFICWLAYLVFDQWVENVLKLNLIFYDTYINCFHFSSSIVSTYLSLLKKVSSEKAFLVKIYLISSV